MNPKNLMIVSMERSGNSWMAAVISEVYQAIYGGDIPQWYHEISRVWAVNPRYPLPEGWCSVYTVDPKLLLKRGYDKIIVLERNLETVERAFFMYQEIPYEEGLKKYPEYFESIRKYWNVIHGGEKIINPRIYYVNLDDLNNYTFDTFNKLFDFLGFPKKIYAFTTRDWCKNYDKEDNLCKKQECGKCMSFEPKNDRPKLIPVNPPERNWQCFSDFLPQGHPVSDTLRTIQLRYACNQTESQIQLQAIKDKKNYADYGTTNMKYAYVPYDNAHNIVNPYKMAPEERDFQGNCSFRVVIDTMVDALEVMKVDGCAMCGSKIGGKNTLEVWRNATIIKHLVVCKECKKVFGYRVKQIDGKLVFYEGDIV